MRVAAASLLLLLPAAASAQGVRLVDTLVLEWRGDNDNGVEGDDDYGVGLTKLYLSGDAEGTSVRAQVDGVKFTNFPDVPSPTFDEPSAFKSEARLERLSVKHTLGEAALVLGDHPRQLGRGFVLSLRKLDELGIDQSLRGGAVEWDGDRVAASVFAGRTNVANLDGVTQKFLEDPEDTLAGASATLHLGRADLSVHGLYLQPKLPTLPELGDDSTVVGGAYLELPATEWLSLYLEGAQEQYTIAGQTDGGSAAYASADVDLQLVSLLAEVVWLDTFQLLGSFDPVLQRRTAYNQPPTLERIDQEVLDTQDVRGARAKLSRSFLAGDLVVYASGMFRRYGPEESLVDALHGYGGLELTYGSGSSRWNASGGYREEQQEGSSFKTMLHGETDWVQPVGGGNALHLTLAHEDRTLLTRDYLRGTTILGLDRSELGSFAVELGYDTFNEETRQLFFAALLTYQASGWLALRSVVGTERGGIKCIGGVCRDFPAFSGARLEATVRHDLL